MNIHEHQAKSLLKQYNISVPNGIAVSDCEEVLDAIRTLGGSRWVVKAQIHAGGRGKAGGVRILDHPDSVLAYAQSLLGNRLITEQTETRGQPIDCLLIEQPAQITKELYVGFLVDRSKQCVVVMVSTAGGMEIETVAHLHPEKILKISIDIGLGLQPFHCRRLFFQCGLDLCSMNSFTDLLLNLYRLFIECDLNLLEINPLVCTQDHSLMCLDAKISIDENALYRHPGLFQLRDERQEDARENQASQCGLSYIALDGNIGCMVNGAGLAMATMDLIQLHGGMPANFLDVGGSATRERVTEAFKIIVSDPKVKAVWVNIFGGIVRCDLIADGILAAVAEVGISVPVVVRLEGNRSDLGTQRLIQEQFNIIAVDDFSEAAKKVVEVARGIQS